MSLVAAEIAKLRTTRTTWVLTGIGWALVALATSVVLFVDDFNGAFTGTDAEVATTVDQIGANAIIVLIVAILVVTTEFRHGTIGRTLQITPSRTRVLAAKLAVGVLYTVAFFATSLVIVAAVSGIAAAVAGVSFDVGPLTLEALWQGPVGLALNALFGVAIGALLRSQVVTITVVLVWLFVAENLVAGLAPAIGRWLPFQALNAVFLAPEAREAMARGEVGPLEPGLGLVVFLGYVVVAVVAAGVLLRTRDV